MYLLEGGASWNKGTYYKNGTPLSKSRDLLQGKWDIK